MLYNPALNSVTNHFMISDVTRAEVHTSRENLSDPYGSLHSFKVYSVSSRNGLVSGNNLHVLKISVRRASSPLVLELADELG
jgi:hypothetical protein